VTVAIRRALALALVLAPAIAAAEPDKPAGLDERAKFEVAPPGRPFTRIAVDNELGDVRVEGYDGSAIVVETHKHAPDEDALDRLHVSLVPNPDGTVRIATAIAAGREVRPVPRGAVRVDLIVRAPRKARVEGRVGSGTLAVANMDAGGDLDAGAGAIVVRNVSGELSTHTVSGATSLTTVFGSVDAQTMSADVDLDTINGDHLIASANHGRIAGRRVRSRDVELTTTDGRIALEAEAALHGRVVVASLRGDVDVRLHRHGQVVVRARGTRVDLGTPMIIRQPDRWLQATFGEPMTGETAAAVELRSQLGAVQFAIIE
jgi:hypothetical protein